MNEKEKEVIKAIEKLLCKIDWHLANKPYPLDNKEKWYIEVCPNSDEDKDSKRSFIVTINSKYLSVSFEKKELHRKGSSQKILTFIENCLVN